MTCQTISATWGVCNMGWFRKSCGLWARRFRNELQLNLRPFQVKPIVSGNLRNETFDQRLLLKVFFQLLFECHNSTYHGSLNIDPHLPCINGSLTTHVLRKVFVSSFPWSPWGHEIKTEYAREMFESSLMRPRPSDVILIFSFELVKLCEVSWDSKALKSRELLIFIDFRGPNWPFLQGACAADPREGPTRPQRRAVGASGRLPLFRSLDNSRNTMWIPSRNHFQPERCLKIAQKTWKCQLLDIQSQLRKRSTTTSLMIKRCSMEPSVRTWGLGVWEPGPRGWKIFMEDIQILKSFVEDWKLFLTRKSR